MNRETACEELRTTKQKNGDPVLGSDSIRRIKELSDASFEKYWAIIGDFLSKNKLSSIPTYNSAWLDFFEYLDSVSCKFDNVTQEIVDGYFSGREAGNTKIYYIKKIFSFFHVNHIDFERYRTEKPIDLVDSEKMGRISAENFSNAINHYEQIRKNSETNSKEYRLATKKLFILEMFFYTPLSMRDVGKYQKGSGEHDAGSIFFQGKRISVPKSLINLIEEMCRTKLFYETNDIKSSVNQMKKDLAEFGMEELESKGAEKTREAIFMKCPQCGEKYLAIVENWCAIQYSENGEYWIVCRERCGNE